MTGSPRRPGRVLPCGLLPSLGVGLLLAVGAGAQISDSRCADCHLGSPEAPAGWHLENWERSPHGSNIVGCEKCHGGDPSTFGPSLAHRGILSPRNPASPTNRQNLPRTCGGCHAGPYTAYQRSRHHEMLLEGNLQVPVCSTCHGEVGAYLLSPRRLEARCGRCHVKGKAGAPRHEDFPIRARALLEEVIAVRELLKQAEPLIARVRANDRRESLQDAYRQAEVPLVEAVDAGHSFVFEQSEERLAVARRRAEALLENLANP